MNEVHYWPASTSQAKVLSYFPLPEALKRLFLEFSGFTGSEQDPSVTVTGLKSLKTSYNADIFFFLCISLAPI